MAEVAAATKAVQALKIGTPARKRKPRSRVPRQRGAGNVYSQANDATVVFTRSEMLEAITVSDQGTYLKHFKITPATFPLLSKIAQHFDQSQWLAVEVYWTSDVGTTTGGSITYGFDWDPTTAESKNKTRAAITALTPSHTGAVYRQTDTAPLKAPKNQLDTLKWYKHNDATASADSNLIAPCTVSVMASSTPKLAIGVLWCRYRIRLRGTTS